MRSSRATTRLGIVTTSETPNAYAELDADAASLSGTPVYGNTYGTRDALGRITAKTETMQGTATNLTYSYTPAGQLDVVSIGGTPARDYDYDPNGNRTHVNVSNFSATSLPLNLSRPYSARLLLCPLMSHH